jgi:hypothetical protein
MKIILTESQIGLLMENEDVFFDLVKKIKSGGLESLRPSELTLYRKYQKHLKKGGELEDFKDVDEYDDKYGMVITSEIPELHDLTFIYDETMDLDDEGIENDPKLDGMVSIGGQIGWGDDEMYTISLAITPKGLLVDYVISNLDDFKESSNKFFDELSNMNPGKDIKSLRSLFSYFLTDEVFPMVK